MGLVLDGGLNLAHECLHLTFMKNHNFCRWVAYHKAYVVVCAILAILHSFLQKG